MIFLGLISLLGLNQTIMAEQSIFTVREYGAKGDGVTLDTAAIQTAIDQCSSLGGGVVLLDRGTFLSGSILLRSNVHLRIEAGARLLASGRIADYITDGYTHHNRYGVEFMMDPCFIFAGNAENVTISGPGEINGNGKTMPNAGDPNAYRPMLIRMLNCRNVRISDISLRDPAGWTTAILDSRDIWCRGVSINSLVNGNGDGLSFDNCQNIVIADCNIVGNDDNICLLSSNKDLGTRNVTISNCLLSSKCANFRIGFLSVGDIENVSVSNCVLTDTEREGIKIQSCEGGTIRNILFDSIVMQNVRRPVFVNLSYGSIARGAHPDGDPAPGRVQGITFRNMRVQDTAVMKSWTLDSQKYEGVTLDASDGTTMTDIVFDQFSYQTLGGVRRAEAALDSYPRMGAGFWHTPLGDYNPALGFFARNVERLTLRDVDLEIIEPDERPVLVADSVSALQVDGLSFNANARGRSMIVLKSVEAATFEAIVPRSSVPVLLELLDPVANIVVARSDLRRVDMLAASFEDALRKRSDVITLGNLED